MLEAAVLVDLSLEPMLWHSPPGRSSVYIPDSTDLWEAIWQNRDNVSGVAHSHPGSGTPSPSYEDLTTFAAVEAALGRRLAWWIISSTHMIFLAWTGPGRLDYSKQLVEYEASWLSGLRELSQY